MTLCQATEPGSQFAISRLPVIASNITQDLDIQKPVDDSRYV